MSSKMIAYADPKTGTFFERHAGVPVAMRTSSSYERAFNAKQ